MTTADTSSSSPLEPLSFWIRFLYVLCNVILILDGLGGIIAIGVAAGNVLEDLGLLAHYEKINVYILLGGSMLTLLVGITALFAIAKRSHATVLTNCVLSVILLLGVLAFIVTTAVISSYTEKGRLYSLMQEEIKSKDRMYINKLQTTLSCCGINGPEDYSEIPESCYVVNGKVKRLHPTGCFKPLRRLIIYNGSIAIGVILLVVIIDIIALILSRLLCRIIEQENLNGNSLECGVKIPRIRNGSEQDTAAESGNEEEKSEEDGTKTEEKEKKIAQKEEASTSNQDPVIPTPPPLPQVNTENNM